jgi:hypothetical protein
MRRMVTAGAILAAAVCAVSAATATGPAITRRTIAGARLGLTEAAYRRTLGPPVSASTLEAPHGWTRLLFPRRRLSVYFARGRRGTGTVVTTWNPAYRTAAGVGPCTSISRLRAVYGKALSPSDRDSFNGIVFAWTLGRTLLFTSNNLYVRSVALYAGGDPRSAKAGGPLSYAAIIAGNEPDPVCP